MDAISPQPLRIAVAGSDGGKVDQHFGQAECFLIYDVGASGAVLAESRSISAHAIGDEDRRDTIVRMLADCSDLLVARIGPMPQAKLAAAGGASKIIVYPDAGHGFHADYRPSYDAQAANDGWNHLKTWFKEHGV